MDDNIDMPLEGYRDYTHQDWQKCITKVSRSLNTLANDVWDQWNTRMPPPLSLVMALRYMHKELDAALYWADREKGGGQ